MSVQHLLKVIQKPRILHDMVQPPKVQKQRKQDTSAELIIDRIRTRKWLYEMQDHLMISIRMLRLEVKFIEHLPSCHICKIELQLDVERYLGNHSKWYLCLQNTDFLEEQFSNCPKEENYYIPCYWDQQKYYSKHGSLEGMENETEKFILDRAKWAYKIIGKQIRVLRDLLKMTRNWRFTEQQKEAFWNLYNTASEELFLYI